VFSLSTALASKLGSNALAAHSIVLSIASFTFMVPLGISQAAAIRVAFHLGEKKKQNSIWAGDAAFFITVLFMTFSGLMLWLLGPTVVGYFTKENTVVQMAAQIILIAAAFQIADGIQVVAAGALRGIAQTKISAAANLIGHWMIGLPIGYYLCFHTPLKLSGLWAGLTIGLFSVALGLFLFWRQKTSNLITTG
jgi:MATE family multidrug resistance protein